MSDWKPYIEWDLLSAGLLPTDWEQQIHDAIASRGVTTRLTGNSDLSREKSRDYAMDVIVVAGDACASALPWLRNLYEVELCQHLLRSFGRTYYVAKDLRSSININCLRGLGAQYEAHVDNNPMTGLLFASDADYETGGQLVFDNGPGRVARVSPRKGLFLAFDAREITHYVSPLRVNMDRISVPMNYYERAEQQDRPAGLDEYLYESLAQPGNDQ